MSDWLEKFEVSRRTRNERAQATRQQLMKRWGSREDVAGVITIDTMGGREIWRRVSGDVFEQEKRS